MPPQENEADPSAASSPPPNSSPPGDSPASPNWRALRVSMKYSFPGVVN